MLKGRASVKGTVLLASFLVTLAVAAPARANPTFADGHGIHVLSQHTLDSRLTALTVSTAALPAAATVRILLPAGYAQHPSARYPVLYLLHGTSGGAADWTTIGGAEQTTAGKPLIVVMPDIALGDNGGGWCTNWYNAGAYGQPEWETFHIDQLIPWIDGNLRTIPTRDGRAIAGLSQGGFCSTSYAARHPDLFAIALSYSGAPDIAYDLEAQLLVTPVINATEVGLDGVPANSMFGDRLSQEINWAAHDPTTLAPNLRGMDLFMYTGNGFPGPLDPSPLNPGGSVIEGGVEQLTQLFHARLQSLGIPTFYDDYGPGTHSWPYWARDLKQSIGPIMADFAHPPPMPLAMTYTSAESRYSVFGWQVALTRQVKEFSTLARAGRGGFELSGSGSAAVTTPAVYRPRSRHTITIRTAAGTIRKVEVAGRDGSLVIHVPLGPSNPVQQYTPQAVLTPPVTYTTTVTIFRSRS